MASVRAMRFNASSPAACQSGMAASAKARGSEVMRQHLGFGGLNVREPLLDHAGDLGVQLLSTALEQRVVSRVLHQRVLERVDGIGGRAATEGQTRTRVSRASASSSWACGISATAAISS